MLKMVSVDTLSSPLKRTLHHQHLVRPCHLYRFRPHALNHQQPVKPDALSHVPTHLYLSDFEVILKNYIEI